MEIKVGAGEWDGSQAGFLILIRPTDQNVVPVDLEICGEANAPRAQRKFAGEIGGHGARAAGRESKIVDNAEPFSVGRLSLSG